MSPRVSNRAATVVWVMVLVLLAAGCSKKSPNSQIPCCANPAAVYAKRLGYRYVIREDTSGGQYGVVIFPDSTECEEWAFYEGRCGQQWTYCERQGYRIVNRQGQNPYSTTYGACVFSDSCECWEQNFIDGKCGPCK